MEVITAYSTLVLAIFTVALVIVAAANFQKFIESVNLMVESLKKQAHSIDLQAESLKAQTKSIDLQSEGIKAQTKSIDLQAQSLRTQTESVELQGKDILLNYKPVIFIKEVIRPANTEDAYDPFKCAFILTNSGKLPARDVTVSVTANIKGSNITVSNSRSTIVEKASIYPGSNLVFTVGSGIGGPGFKLDKGEYRFRIAYKGDGLSQEMYENMKYIFNKQTGNQWVYVGPTVDIFFKEKFDEKKAKYTDLADVEISEGRQQIMKQIVDRIIGIDKVLKQDPSQLTSAFGIICKEIREGKHPGLNAGALTGLRTLSVKSAINTSWRHVGIIDNNDQLTPIGLSVLKCIAEIMKADELDLSQ